MRDNKVVVRKRKCESLLLDSGVFGFPMAQEFSRIFEALEKSGLTGRDRDTNRVIRPRHVHDPGIQ